ncbi:hypothetical protein GCM10010168_07260 [Actinoplanes ianthinogenes]|uniref:Uncharacterized protein n=1 Tax=Actinoplanes ianthinogenes TaxID=122358 RepID=A0ABM7LTD0_9ACTN|nr:hypothetical protein [Actinoplanes ianthinogenes]BCJ42532.1 hypothetical protein Aiant_31890 [Actinoplanes ianthinogenes]GGQ93968.1 hypothetical protein GCM10010168_07260 [Actinoplanes ianthinogenes]
MASVVCLTLGLGPRLGFALPGAPGLGWPPAVHKPPNHQEDGNRALPEPEEHTVADLIRA